MHPSEIFRNAGGSSLAELPCIIDARSGAAFSYADVENLSSRLANHFVTVAGLKPGNRVLLLADNRVETVLSYFACFHAGLVSIPVHPSVPFDELAVIAKTLHADLFVSASDVIAKMKGFSADALSVPCSYLFERDVTINALPAVQRLSPQSFPYFDEYALAHIMHSSGTTAEPKAIPLCGGTILRHARMFAEFQRFRTGSIFYNTLPIAYLGGWYNMVLVPLFASGTIALDRAFGPETIYRFWDTVRTTGATCLWFTPSMLSTLLTIGVDSDENRRYAAERITWAMSGMAPLPLTVKRSFERTFGIPLLQSYGLSETFLFFSGAPHLDVPEQAIGPLLPGYSARCITAEGKTAELDEEGEIQVQSSYIFEGYLGQKELSKAAFTEDGFFKTGDLGKFDMPGNLHITGRIKDVIIKGGLNISPLEIENILAELPAIKEVAVVGLPDPLSGEKILAAIVFNAEKRPLSKHEIREYFQSRVHPLKIPDDVAILDELPKTSSGKVQKKELRKRFS